MPRPKKRARLAQAQRAAGSRVFSDGLILDIENLKTDPTYVPDIEDPDSDTDSVQAEKICQVMGSQDSSEQMSADGEEGGEDGSEELEDVETAVKSAHSFWKAFMEKVKVSLHTRKKATD